MTSRDRPVSGAIAPTTVRIPPDLRDLLQREADINGKTLSAEIVARLKTSLDVPAAGFAQGSHATGTTLNTAEAPPAWAGPGQAPRPMSDTQRMLLSLFDALPPDKQLALLTVIRR